MPEAPNKTVLKMFTCLLVLVLSGFVCKAQQRPFITLWKSDNLRDGSSNADQITIPVNPAYNYNYLIHWESADENVYSGDLGNLTGSATITFPEAGIYRVEITGDFPQIYFNNSGDRSKFIDVVQWGDIVWEDFAHSFYGCDQMKMSANDAPDLSLVTSFLFTFAGATKFNQKIGHWDVSCATTMKGAFMQAVSFNQPLSNWDVSSVTNMMSMFFQAKSFNQPLGSWDVSCVENMEGMFMEAESYNQPLNNWEVTSVKNIKNMFYGAISFNQPLNDWNLFSVTDLSYMFYGASSFNQTLEKWDVSSVNKMSCMFMKALSFNMPLSNWDISSVTDMQRMFCLATSFNQPLQDWELASLINVNGMFYSASSFNQDLSHWNFNNIELINSFVSYSGLSVENYDKLLMKLINYNSLPRDINFDSDQLKYCNGELARKKLINEKGWVFNDLKGCD